MVQLPAAGLTQNRYSGDTQLGPVAFAVKVTGLPAVVDEGGAALRLTEEQPLAMLKDRITFPAPTKICPPASLGVENRLAPKLAL